MRQTKTEQIIDHFGIDLWATYSYKNEYHTEECHGIHTMDYVDVQLESVEIEIGGTRIDILPQMNVDQEQVIIGELQIH
jgi:hypothetical protein